MGCLHFTQIGNTIKETLKLGAKIFFSGKHTFPLSPKEVEHINIKEVELHVTS